MKSTKIVLFFVITFVWSWLWWLPYVLPRWGVLDGSDLMLSLKMPFSVIGASGPLVSALILLYAEGGLKAIKTFFKKCLQFRIKPLYYIIAIGLSVLTTALVHYYPNIMGLRLLPNNYFPVEADLPLVLVFIIYIFVMFLIGGGQEEFGWRGYILDPLQDKIGLIKASLLIGLLWGLWHYPLWLMPGESHVYYSFIGFVLFAISFSVMIGIMYQVSGKKMVIAWVMHAASNYALSLFPVFFNEDVAQPSYWVWVILNMIIALIMMLWYINTRKKNHITY